MRETLPIIAPLSDRRGDAPAVRAGAGASPLRHQRSRKKGARTPDGLIYVGRPTVYGNPFPSARFGHARSVALYRLWIERRLGALTLGRLGFNPSEIDALTRWRKRLDKAMPRLVGSNLQCWCPTSSRWCHADVLLEYAASFAAVSRPQNLVA